ncbi:MAG: transposase [Segetibacter sp.]|nr:transposase [Segetibacter sp.]
MHEQKIIFMQTTKRATGLRTAAGDYETLVQRAINKVTGFEQLYKELERAINVTGKSTSTLTNDSRHLAHLALHYHILPTELDNEQVLDYLHRVKARVLPLPASSSLLFKVCGMPVSSGDYSISNSAFLLLSEITSYL